MIQRYPSKLPSGKTNIWTENGPSEDVFPIEHGDFALPCLFTGVYLEVKIMQSQTGISDTPPKFTSSPLLKRDLTL